MNTIQNFITIFLLISLGIISFLADAKNQNSIDFKKKVINFTNSEDERNIDKVLDSYVFPILRYWEYENIYETELKDLYKNYWNRFEYSKNYIQKLEKINDFEIILTTKYEFKKTLENENKRIRLSKTKFTFNSSGKIIAVDNLSLKIVNKEYVIKNNLVENFSYSSPKELDSEIDYQAILISLIFINLVIQGLFFVGKEEKKLIISNKDTSVIELKKKAEEKLELEKQNREKLAKEERIKKELEKTIEKGRLEIEKKNREKQRLQKEKICKEKLAKEERNKNEQERIKKELEKKIEKNRIERKKTAKEEEALKITNKRKNRDSIKIETQLVEKVNQQDSDDFFDSNLSKYITVIEDDVEEVNDDDLGNYLTEKYMNRDLKNKLNGK